jgi:hypothetical protein
MPVTEDPVEGVATASLNEGDKDREWLVVLNGVGRGGGGMEGRVM